MALALGDKTTSAIIKAVGMCVSTGVLAFLLYKMQKYLDPHYEAKKDVIKKMVKLRKVLSLKPDVELNSHEMRMAAQIVMPEEDEDLSDVGGCSSIIKQLEESILLPLQLQASNIKFPSAFYKPPKGVLLFGPPGCGKTLIARSLAKKTKAHFINFDISVLNDMWFGETSKLTKALFTLARKIQPCIVFIDEIDSLLRSRSYRDHEITAVMKTQFMTFWDGFSQTDDAVIIIGATNRAHDVDEAILRRLPFRVHVPKPDLRAREEIIRVLLRTENTSENFDYHKVAIETDSLSGSDIKEIIRLSCFSKFRNHVQELIASDQNRKIENDDCLVTISDSDLVDYARKYISNTKEIYGKHLMLANTIALD